MRGSRLALGTKDERRYPADRPRPRIHFTATGGWVNDPYGIVWAGGTYHLFYQALPDRVEWAASCHWGHAVSPDLLHWRERPPALTPQPFEIGCWSGTVVVSDPEMPTLFYTRVDKPDWGQARIARADGDRTLTSWTTEADDVVVNGPPPDLPVHSFRDPFIFRDADGWVMIVGAGLADGAAAVLQYRSAELRSWTYQGVLCTRSGAESDGARTGTMWECPQLFPLGDRWVLLVSVSDPNVLHYVAGAVGHYDGRRFLAESWQRLTHGSCAYAMSAFEDRAGRRCVTSWLREEALLDARCRWAGAHSVPALLERGDDGLLAIRPHPDLGGGSSPLEPTAHAHVSGPVIVSLATGQNAEVMLNRSSPTGPIRVRVLPSAGVVTVERSGLADGRVPFAAGSAAEQVQLLLDADLLEVYAPGGYGAFRIPVTEDEYTLTATEAPLTIRSLD